MTPGTHDDARVALRRGPSPAEVRKIIQDLIDALATISSTPRDGGPETLATARFVAHEALRVMPQRYMPRDDEAAAPTPDPDAREKAAAWLAAARTLGREELGDAGERLVNAILGSLFGEAVTPAVQAAIRDLLGGGA